jgi:hypothetical protein
MTLLAMAPAAALAILQRRPRAEEAAAVRATSIA